MKQKSSVEAIKNKMTVSVDKWNSLSENEKELAKRIGITPERTRTPAAPRAVALKEYVLGIILDCSLCGETTIQHYVMTRYIESRIPCLVAKKVASTADLITNRWELRKTSTCTSCKDALRHWPKDKLITQILYDRTSLKLR